MLQEFDAELVSMFVIESREMLDAVEPVLIESAQQTGELPATIERVNFIFRLFHSIKGSAGFLRFDNLSAVTHEVETVLDAIRTGKRQLTPPLCQALVKTCDYLRDLMATIERSGQESDCGRSTQQVIELIRKSIDSSAEIESVPPPSPEAPETTEAELADAIIEGRVDQTAPSPEAPASGSAVINDDMVRVFVQDADEHLDHAERTLIELLDHPERIHEHLREAMRDIHTFKGNSGLMCYDDLCTLSHKMEEVLEAIREGLVPAQPPMINLLIDQISLLREVVVNVGAGRGGQVSDLNVQMKRLCRLVPDKDRNRKEAEATTEAGPATTSRADVEAGRPASETARSQNNIRVNVDKLDHLSNLVGELVISEAMVTGNPDLKGLRLDNFHRAAHRLSAITAELQDLAMSLRMIPIDATLKKLIRLSHDTSTKTGKKVELQLVGTDTEVDRTVAELIADPLVHVVRNAIDHGIETPEERRAAGKAETGRIVIEASHQAGEVRISVRDDGQGLDCERILERAIERGLVTAEQAAKLSDSEIYPFIFAPGFSTASRVTNLSGRGVGMDVVKKNIEQLNGRTEIRSTRGQGSELLIRIPLTLAIINGMLVRVGQDRYIVPLPVIEQSFRPTPDMLGTVTDKGETVLLRGHILPLFRLSKLFDVEGAEQDPCNAIIMVVEADDRKIALLVDELLGQQQTVIKSLGEALRGIEGICGACILPDGHVALIMDMGAMAKLAHHTSCR